MARRAALALACVVLLAGCGGGREAEPRKAEPRKAEPRKAEPRKAETRKAEPRFLVGAVEDRAKSDDAREQMRLARDSGFRAIALSAVWHRGERRPSDLDALRRAVDAAAEEEIRPIVAVYSFSGDTPLTEAERADFAAFAASIPRELPDVRDVIVGNEPNLNLFWLPQFAPDGSDAAAIAFEQLLARTYDALKDVDEDVNVIGAGVSPRGGDKPDAPRQTQSPTRFLLDLGAAYRASGRGRPLMDMLSIHPYGESPRVPPSLVHRSTTSIGIADYSKLVDLLGEAFGGTAQRGRDLPIVYGEYGVETQIPAAKASVYTGTDPVPAVDEATQARYYVQAIRLAACQPTVRMLLLFHVVDEPRLEGLQSGVRYADGSPKTSLARVRAAAERARCAS